MKDFTFREIWLPLDVNGDEEARTLNGGTPMIYKGAEVMFRIGLFDVLPVNSDNPGTFRNHANLVAFLLKIRSGSYAGSLQLDSSAGGDLSFDPTVTEAQFLNKQKAPISVYLPGSITGITAGELYMTFTGLTSESAQPDAFGRARVTVTDIGIGTVSSAPAAGVQVVTTDMFRAALNGCVKYGKNPAGKSFTLVSPNGQKGRNYSVDDKGTAGAKLETYS